MKSLIVVALVAFPTIADAKIPVTEKIPVSEKIGLAEKIGLSDLLGGGTNVASSVPEPSALFAVGAGLALLAAAGWFLRRG